MVKAISTLLDLCVFFGACQAVESERRFYSSDVGVQIRKKLYELMSRPEARAHMERMNQGRPRIGNPKARAHDWYEFGRKIIKVSKTVPVDNSDLHNWAQTHFTQVCEQIMQIFKNTRLQAKAEGSSVFISARNVPGVFPDRLALEQHCLQRTMPYGQGVNGCGNAVEAAVIQDQKGILSLFDTAWQYDIMLHEDFFIEMTDSVGGSSSAYTPRHATHVEILPRSNSTLRKFPMAEASLSTRQALERAFKVIVGRRLMS
jgi:hypothetical protein